MSNSKHLLVGLPASGKTTFLAALWHVVTSEEVSDSLQLVRLEGDREYITEICDAWLECKPIGRTVVDQPNISMHLKTRGSSNGGEVMLPDIAGEQFEKIFELRNWTRAIRDYVREIQGVILFLHPEGIIEPLLILDVDRMIGQDASAGQEQVEPWNPRKSCTQVKIVDILQIILDEHDLGPFRGEPLNLAVIISAWDLVEGRGQTLPPDPRKWMSERLPLLRQYLEANPESIQAMVVGISAQGGDLLKSKDNLLSKEKPSERIQVRVESDRSHDITSPIKWIIDRAQTGQ